MGWESFGVVGFHLKPLLPGQTKIAKLKVLITRVLLVLEVWDGKPTYRKSWAGMPNLQLLITRLLLVLQVWDGKQATGNHGLGIFLCCRI